MSNIKYAIVKTNKSISNYMPSRYYVLGPIDVDGVECQVISGVDFHGWTLDGYVIPRLASGMFFCQEIQPENLIKILMENR